MTHRDHRFAVLAAVLLLAALSSAAPAVTTAGSNFDGIMSLIYDFNTGNVFIENAPLANPAIQRVQIASSGVPFVFGNLNVPVLSPTVTVNSQTASLLDIEWSSGNFLGTGSFLGQILAPSITQATLLADLTIQYKVGVPPTTFLTGDLLHTSIVGSTAGNPVLPTGSNGFYRFFNVATGQFMDPPAPPTVYGFLYQMESGSQFTEVGLPYGFGNNFTIMTGNTVLASGLLDGSLYVFSSPVSTFSITGLNPQVTANDPAAFPVFMEFDTPTASFNMTALVPEPASAMALSLGVLLLARARRV